MNWRAVVLSPWLEPAEHPKGKRGPRLWVYYPVTSGSDVTGQPVENLAPEPNLLLVEIECEAAVLALIAADARYHALWSEEVASSPATRAASSPGNSEFGQTVAWLRQQVPAGMGAGEWAQIGNNPLGRTRTEIATELADWFATFPKAEA